MLRCKLGDCIKEVVEKTTKNNQYEVLSVTKDGIYSQEEFFKKQIASENNVGYKVIKKNNLVFSTMNLWMGSLDVLTNYEIGIVSPAYKIFEFDESKMLPEFAKYFMKSHVMLERYKDCSEQGASVVRRNLDLEQLLDTDISIPDIKAQEQIVRLLDKADRIINSYDKLIKDKEQFIKSQFVEMFGDVFSDKNKFKKMKIKEVARIVSGSTPSTSNISYWNGNINWITPAELDDKTMFYGATERKITEEGVKKASLEIMPIGTVLFTTRAPIGKVGITIEEMACNQGFKNCICNKGVLNNIYLYYLLKLNKEKFEKYGSGSTFQEISKNTFENISVAIPNIELQNKFSRIIQLIDKQKFNYIEKIKLLNKLKNIQGAKKNE